MTTQTAKNNVIKLHTRKEPTLAEIDKALKEGVRKPEAHQQAIRQAVETYSRMGLHPLRLNRGTKKIEVPGWQTGSVNFEPEDFSGFNNIGILLGGPSNNLVDFDIDDVELIAAAEHFLPPTSAKFGRYYGSDKQKLGHWVYRISESREEEEPFTKVDLKLPKKCLSSNGKNTQYEIRGNGHQTMFPPSYILDNERNLDLICWEGGAKAPPPDFNSLPVVTVEQLDRAGRLMSASHRCLSQFSAGSYHDDMLSWCGVLVKAGYSEEEITRSLEYIVKHTGQDGLKDRLSSLKSTMERYELGETVVGISALEQSGWDKDLIRWLRKDVFKVKKEVDYDGRPQVRVVAARETELYNNTLKAMIESGKFYLYNREVAVIDKEDNVARVCPLTTTASMVGRLTREIQFIQSSVDKSTGQYIDQLIKCPKSVATEMADPANHHDGLTRIYGVSNIPTITLSGRIVDEDWGCDSELGLFFSSKFQHAKMYPEQALAILEEMFCDFPFVKDCAQLEEMEDDYDREAGVGAKKGNLSWLPSYWKESGDGLGQTGGKKKAYGRYAAAAISSVLSAVVRPALDICPAYVITSSQWSDGKSVMSNAITAAVGMEGGSPNSPLTRGGSDEEQEKQISSVLARGKRVVVYDNHDGEFRSSCLTETLTSANPEFRVLGKSEVKSVSNRSMFIINGVNIVLSGELRSRTVVIQLARTNLDVERTFKHFDLIGWAGDNSEKIVSAAISLIDWALKQDDGDWKPTHRFKSWDRLVRRTIMLTCGVDISPPASLDKEQPMDPVEEIKHQFLEWVVERWNSGVRCKDHPAYFTAAVLAREIAVESDQENWVTMLSKRRFDSVDVRVGRSLSLVKNFPFSTQNGVFRIMSRVANKRNVYFVEKI